MNRLQNEVELANPVPVTVYTDNRDYYTALKDEEQTTPWLTVVLLAPGEKPPSEGVVLDMFLPA